MGANEDPDLALLDRWRTGDARAGHDLFLRHFADLYRFFEYKAGAEADDLVQQTFAACVAGRDRFRGASSFRSYLFAIARKQLYSFLRRLLAADHVDFDEVSLATVATSFGTRLARAQDIEQLRIALAALPAEQQLLLELHYWHELDAEALGEVFDATPDTVRVRLLRARRALRKRLGKVELPLHGSSPDRLVSALRRSD